MPSQQQISNTPPAKRDSWQTPQWLFDWANNRYDFTIDLAASIDNSKVYCFYTTDHDALSVDWAATEPQDAMLREVGWCNPPYSETGKWLAKAWQEAQQGFQSVFLVNAPNGESYWQKYVFGKASEIIFINGRVAFELPDENGKPIPQPGNTRGSCLVVFNRTYKGHTAISWIDRDAMIKEYNNDSAA